jgi:hypothetical protein
MEYNEIIQRIKSIDRFNYRRGTSSIKIKDKSFGDVFVCIDGTIGFKSFDVDHKQNNITLSKLNQNKTNNDDDIVDVYKFTPSEANLILLKLKRNMAEDGIALNFYPYKTETSNRVGGGYEKPTPIAARGVNSF